MPWREKNGKYKGCFIHTRVYISVSKLLTLILHHKGALFDA